MYTTSPNMNLTIPIVGQTTGPEYATDNNNCLNTVDAHDHSAGNGVPITPAGMNINTALNFQSNKATTLYCTSFAPQTTVTDVASLYVKGVDLYYNDYSGNVIRLTQSGSVAGVTGTIGGLASPASAAYVSGTQTFVWQSNTNVAANMDFASAIFRNTTVSSNGITLQAPASLATNYSLVLPTLPAAQKFMTLDASGNMAAPWQVDGTTITITGNQLKATPFAPTAPYRDTLFTTGTITGRVFVISGTANFTTGAVYSNNGNNYTVIYTGSSATHISCMGTGTPTSSGTLSKVSGTGDATITFTSTVATATYTPTGSPLYIKFQLVGGGGGGARAHSASYDGTPSVLGPIICYGGQGGGASGQTVSLGGGCGYLTTSGWSIQPITGGGGQGLQTFSTGGGATSNTGGMGGASPFGGAGAGGGTASPFTGSAASAGSGSGGGGYGSQNGSAFGGAAGGYATGIATSNITSFQYAVGLGGTAEANCGTGGSAVVVIEGYYQ